MKKTLYALALVLGGLLSICLLCLWGAWLLLRPFFYIPVFVYRGIRYLIKKPPMISIYSISDNKQILKNKKHLKKWQKMN